MAFKDIEARRAYFREYNKGWYQRHREKRIALITKRRLAFSAWFKKYKSNLCCTECGESHPACLQFHHKDKTKKSFTIGAIVGRSTCSMNTLMKEIEKCEVLCGNCHAIRHWDEMHGTDDWTEVSSSVD
jgi:hypothetical protein